MPKALAVLDALAEYPDVPPQAAAAASGPSADGDSDIDGDVGMALDAGSVGDGGVAAPSLDASSSSSSSSTSSSSDSGIDGGCAVAVDDDIDGAVGPAIQKGFPDAILGQKVTLETHFKDGVESARGIRVRCNNPLHADVDCSKYRSLAMETLQFLGRGRPSFFACMATRQ